MALLGLVVPLDSLGRSCALPCAADCGAGGGTGLLVYCSLVYNFVFLRLPSLLACYCFLRMGGANGRACDAAWVRVMPHVTGVCVGAAHSGGCL